MAFQQSIAAGPLGPIFINEGGNAQSIAGGPLFVNESGFPPKGVGPRNLRRKRHAAPLRLRPFGNVAATIPVATPHSIAPVPKKARRKKKRPLRLQPFGNVAATTSIPHIGPKPKKARRKNRRPLRLTPFGNIASVTPIEEEFGYQRLHIQKRRRKHLPPARRRASGNIPATIPTFVGYARPRILKARRKHYRPLRPFLLGNIPAIIPPVPPEEFRPKGKIPHVEAWDLAHLRDQQWANRLTVLELAGAGDQSVVSALAAIWLPPQVIAPQDFTVALRGILPDGWVEAPTIAVFLDMASVAASDAVGTPDGFSHEQEIADALEALRPYLGSIGLNNPS